MAQTSATTSGAGLRIAVATEGDAEELLRLAEVLAADLGLPLARGTDRERFGLLLVRTDERLELRETGRGRSGPVFVDFLGERMGRRRRNVVGAERMLAKAIGFKGKPLSVVDATAGLGRDAFLLACMGCEVTAVERSAVIAALLADGLRRAAADPELGKILRRRLRLVRGDARGLLREMGESQRPDVVYLDPMFPSRQKSAAVKKEMRICRAVTGDDPDAAELFEIAVAVARRRVVVKRPLQAPTLGRKPTMAYKARRSATTSTSRLPAIGPPDRSRCRS
jgi:16S rRNA (guanine1516-N2)-methyltransferase